MTSVLARLSKLEQQWPADPPRDLPADAEALAQAAGFVLDPWQRQVARSTARQIILNTSRQVGKSTITAVVAVDTALRQPGSLVLLASPTLRQSGELFRKCTDVYRAAGRPVPVEAESALRLELEGGSRIVSLPGVEASVRGYSSVALLCLDEASRIDDALYYGLRPALAVSGGRLMLLSTPAGKRGVFFDVWENGQDWERVEVRADQCPRIPQSFLESERTALPSWIFDQEYCCAFNEAEDAVFRHEDIAALFDPSIPPLFSTEVA